MAPDRILVFWPRQGVDSKPIDRCERLRSKSTSRDVAALEIPQQGLSDFRLCLGQNLDGKPSHRALSFALASAQGTALTIPARKAACRARISCRHACEIELSSLPSRLSSKATDSADRSSGGSPRASSRMWFTVAFMRQSLALKPVSVTFCARPTPTHPDRGVHRYTHAARTARLLGTAGIRGAAPPRAAKRLAA